MTRKSTSPDNRVEERSAGFVLFRREDDRRVFLLLRHRNGRHWSFPKGRIEEGEDELRAAQRETREETGIRVSTSVAGFRSISRYRFFRRGRTIEKTVAYFLAEVHEREVRLSPEHTAARWLRAAEARGTLSYEEGRRILDAAEHWLAGADRHAVRGRERDNGNEGCI